MLSLIQHVSMLEEIFALEGLAFVSFLSKTGCHMRALVMMAMFTMMPMLMVVRLHGGS
jgi:ABC-type sugar transport system permease subunit